MSLPADDRSLRRLVVELASVRDADVRQILAELNGDQRERVKALLASYGGEAPARDAPKAVATAPDINLEGLSPWLIVRLGAKPARARGVLSLLRRRRGPGPMVDFRMTLQGREALRSCAAKVQGPTPPRAPGVRAALERLISSAVARR